MVMSHDDSGLRRSALRMRNEARILEAAQHVFAAYGFHGATIDRVAERARMSQPNLHNYFKTKAALYAAVLDQTLDIWLSLIDNLNTSDDPATGLRRYISQKMAMSRQFPDASRVFANEILRGAPVLKPQIRGKVRDNVEHFRQVIDNWVADGKLKPVDAYHLIFLIWGATQHYADFQAQIKMILDVPRLAKADFDAAADSICAIVLDGLLP